jgi:hypothetical protein
VPLLAAKRSVIKSAGRRRSSRRLQPRQRYERSEERASRRGREPLELRNFRAHRLGDIRVISFA